MKTTVRLASPADVSTYLEYNASTLMNMFDRDIAEYPSLRTLAVDVNNKPSLFVPFHPCLVIESLAHRPGISARENALCISRADQQIAEYAKAYGMSELWFMCRDGSLIEAAQKRGYEVVKSSVLRRKVV